MPLLRHVICLHERARARLRACWRSFIDVLALALVGAIWALNDQTDQRDWAQRRARRRLDRRPKGARVMRRPRLASPS